LIWWLVFDIVGCRLLTLLAGYWHFWLAKTSLLTSEFEPFVPWKLWAIVLAFQQKKPELIWTSRTQDMNWKPNSVWVARQIPTSPLLLRFQLENGRIESSTPMKVYTWGYKFYELRRTSSSDKIVKIVHQQTLGQLQSNCYCLVFELLLSDLSLDF
jgi:hypothetical protein